MEEQGFWGKVVIGYIGTKVNNGVLEITFAPWRRQPDKATARKCGFVLEGRWHTRRLKIRLEDMARLDGWEDIPTPDRKTILKILKTKNNEGLN